MLGLKEKLQAEIDQWQQVRRRYEGSLLETQAVMDHKERVIERIDHPRVSFIPTLRYGKPDPARGNWTLLTPEKAQQLASELDRLHAAFAPHRAQDIRELARDRIAAAERGLRVLEAQTPAVEEPADPMPEGPRP